jgi:hypothetical protein
LIAFRRVQRTRKPVNTVARDAGTKRDPTCSGASGRTRANKTAAPVAIAPRSSEVMKPMSGSISRRISASRIARWRRAGIAVPLMRIAAAATTNVCTPKPP